MKQMVWFKQILFLTLLFGNLNVAAGLPATISWVNWFTSVPRECVAKVSEKGLWIAATGATVACFGFPVIGLPVALGGWAAREWCYHDQRLQLQTQTLRNQGDVRIINAETDQHLKTTKENMDKASRFVRKSGEFNYRTACATSAIQTVAADTKERVQACGRQMSALSAVLLGTKAKHSELNIGLTAALAEKAKLRCAIA